MEREGYDSMLLFFNGSGEPSVGLTRYSLFTLLFDEPLFSHAHDLAGPARQS